MADPSDIDVDIDPEQWLIQHRTAPIQSAFKALDENPDDAAQALTIGPQIGVPPSIVHTDLEGYQQKQKAALTASLLENNEHLRDYINSHPLAASVSNDDWGQLDTISKQLSPARFKSSVAKAVIQGAIQGWGEGPPGSTYLGIQPYKAGDILPPPDIKDLPAALTALVGVPLELAIAKVPGAAITAGTQGFVEAVRQLTGQDFSEQGEKFLQVISDPGTWASIGFPDPLVGVHKFLEANKQLKKEIELAAPYALANKEPPHVLSEQLTELAKEQTKADSKVIQDLLSEAGKSSTRQRAPELFRDNFIKPRTEDARIGIDADAVLALYGDKRPMPDDGILGWVPNIAEQYERAAATGADVEIPVADFLSQEITPELAKALKDHIRVRAGGLTPEEAKAPLPMIKAGREGIEDVSPEEMEELQGQPANMYKKEIEKSYEGALDEQIRQKWRAAEGDVRTFDEWKKIAEAENITALGNRPNAFAAAREYSTRNPNTPTIITKPITGERSVFVNGERVYREKMDRKLIELKQQEIESRWRKPSILDSVRESAGLNLEVPEPKGALGKIQPALPPQGVIPDTSLLGQALNYRGLPLMTDATFPLKEGLSQIKTERLNDFQRTLTEMFSRTLSDNVGDIKVHAIPDSDFDIVSHKIWGDKGYAGLYDPATNQILVRTTHLLGEYGHDWATGMLLHEGGHALTTHYLDSHPEVKDIFDAMRTETIQALKDAKQTKLLNDQYIKYLLSNADEFFSGGYGDKNFREILSATPISEGLANRVRLSTKGNNMWDAFRQLMSDIFYWTTGHRLDNTMLDAFLKMQEHFEKSKPQEPIDLLPKGTKIPEGGIPDYLRKAFKTGSALKMNNERLKGYLENIVKQHEEAIKFSKDMETLRAGKEATKDWKENLPRVTEESRRDIWSRPDIALDRYLRDGEFPNGSRETPIRIAKNTIPEEYHSRIPDSYIRERGVHPDVLAARFGLQSGREVLEHLARLKEQRELEGLTPATHVSQLVDQEVQRRMNKDYGVSAEELLDAAKEHVFSPTTHDILHDELAALYEMNGQQPITQSAFKAFAKQLFNRIPIGLHSSDKYTAEMQRQRMAALDALLEDKPVESLKAQEKAAMLAYHADLSLKLEKQIKQFDNRAEKWIRREPPGIEGKYALWIHDILGKIGYQVKRIDGDWERQLELIGGPKTLKEFVNKVSNVEGQDPDAMFPGQFPVATFLQDDEFFKPRDELTPSEFTDVFNSLKAIDKFARNDNKLTVGGNKEDLQEVLQGLATRLKESNRGKTVSPGIIAKYMRAGGSLLLNPESWMNRLDLGNASGPFNQLIIRPIMEGLYQERDLEKEFARLWKALPDIGKREKIANPNLFMDPQTNFTTPMELNTHSLRAIIQNMGNELQRKKLASGYGIDDPNKIWDWLFNTVGITKEHFQFAQQMGDIFSKAFEGTEKADVNRFGVAPQRIELGEIQTPWGMEKEWYHPLIPDPLRHSGSLKAEDMLDESGFYRPSPSSGFRQQRTGAVYAVDLGFDAVPFKLKQILKYNAMSNPVSEVGKVVLDARFRNAFKAYYGLEYENALTKWLKDVAGNRDWVPSGEGAVARGLGQLQENMASSLIGLNVGTVLKHGPSALFMSMREVGPVNFAQSFARMVKEFPGSQEMWNQSFEKSAELRSRWRSMGETITGTNEELFRKYEKGHTYFKIRDAIKAFGHWPVAMSDLLSAVAMWDAAYRKALTEGADEGTAVYNANTQVRRTHGSTIIGARAGITRTGSGMGGAIMRLSLPFYNFFGNALQRNYEMAWRSKLAIQGRELSEMTGFERESYEKSVKHIPYILGGMMVFGPILGLIEQAVDPIEQGEEEGNIKFWGKVLTRQYTSMIPWVRDYINAVYTGHDPTVGMLGTIPRTVKDAFSEKVWSGEDPGKTWRKAHGVIGAFTGLTNEAFGKVGQYIINYMADKEDEIRGPEDVYQAYRHGTLERKPRNISEHMEEIMGVPRSQR